MMSFEEVEKLLVHLAKTNPRELERIKRMSGSGRLKAVKPKKVK